MNGQKLEATLNRTMQEGPLHDAPAGRVRLLPRRAPHHQRARGRRGRGGRVRRQGRQGILHQLQLQGILIIITNYAVLSGKLSYDHRTS